MTNDEYGYENEPEFPFWAGALLGALAVASLGGVVWFLAGAIGGRQADVAKVEQKVPAPNKLQELELELSKIKFDGEDRPLSGVVFDEPPAPDKMFLGEDLSEIDPDSLESFARKFVSKGNYKSAIPLQYWASRSKDGCFYNLACYYARENQIEAAFYFLQHAAITEASIVVGPVKTPT